MASESSFGQSVGDIFEQRQYKNTKGDSLLYRWLTPDTLAEGYRYPLVLFLHGAGERGNDNLAQLKHVMPRFADPTLRKRYPAFVFAPQCPSNDTWSNGRFVTETNNYEIADSMGQTLQLTVETLSLLMKRYPIDTNRVYVVGLSMGGAGTWELAMRYASFFAAAVPVCGFADPRYAPRIKDLPVWVFHGREDDIVPVSYARQIVQVLYMTGSMPIYTEFPGVKHNSWDRAFSEQPFIYDWLFGQRRTPSTE